MACSIARSPGTGPATASRLPHDLPAEQQREWAVLDTFDMFSPEHDHPQRIGDVAAMFRRAFGVPPRQYFGTEETH